MINIQVLQKKTYKEVNLQRCLVKISSIIYNCGFDSLPYISYADFAGEIRHLDRKNCNSALTSGTFITPYGLKKVSGILPNSAGVVTLDLMGSTESSGSCFGTSFNYKGRNYNNHVMKASVEYKFFEDTASWNLEEGSILFKEGLESTYETGELFDATHGDFYWSPKTPECTVDIYDVLYQGPANHSIDEDGITTLIIYEDSFALAAKIGGSTRACGMLVFSTSLEGVKIAYQTNGAYQFSKDLISPENLDVFRYVSAKMGYLFVREGLSENEMWKKIGTELCLLEFRQLSLAIDLLIAVPDAHVRLPRMPLGSIARLMGEVLFIYSCRLVHVKPAIFDRCVQEIPVEHKNDTYFLRPFSRMLSKEFSEVPCSSDMSPTFKINGQWRSYSPNPGPAPIPLPLYTSGNSSYTRKVVWDDYDVGIYPIETLKKLQQIFTFGQRRVGITSSAAAKSFANDEGGQYSLLNSLSQSDWSSFSGLLWNYLQPFERLGTWVSVCLGLIAAFSMIRYVIVTIWRFVKSPADVNFGRRLCMAFNGTAFFWWHALKTEPKATAPQGTPPAAHLTPNQLPPYRPHDASSPKLGDENPWIKSQ